MSELERDIAAYRDLQSDLEAKDMGKWVVLQGGKLAGSYDSFDLAAGDAVQRFGRGPYLIRQVGAPPVTLPASVMYQHRHGTDKVRL